MAYKEVFKVRLSARREELGLTQGKVATDTEINQSKISKYENGQLEPTLEILGKLANYYEVSIDWLLGNPHSGKEGSLVKAAINKFAEEIEDTVYGATDPLFTKEDIKNIILEETKKSKNSIIDKYGNN